MLPRALRIPGPKTDANLHFSNRQSKWLDENTLLDKKTEWKGQYKLRHNWSIGACEVQEIHVADRPSVPSMLVKLAEGVVLTVDKGEGLRAWSLKDRELIVSSELEEGTVPTCLAVDEEAGSGQLGIAVGFMNGGWGTWRLDIKGKKFVEVYRHPESSNGMLSAVAYATPYILTITDSQLLSLYTFTPTSAAILEEDGEEERLVETVRGKSPILSDLIKTRFTSTTDPKSSVIPALEPHLLASLKSHTSWPPLSLSIRTTSSTIIASIAYSLPTYYSGYTIGLQELHLSTTTGTITFSRLSSALPQGFSSILSSILSSPSSGTSSPVSGNSRDNMGPGSNTRPTTLSYSHPYILATHPDNTLTLYLCTSTASTLHISPGTKLWGHTSSVSSAEITARGKAVSVSTRGNELRVWELEGGFSSSTPSKNRRLSKRDAPTGERSVKIRPESKDGEIEGSRGALEGYSEEVGAQKRWVGFDDEMVIVLKESEQGTQALMVYDFT